VKGRDHQQSGDSKVGFTDWYVSTLIGKLGQIMYGKIKEPYIYEIVGDSANLQQQERILSPFFIPTRNIGVKMSNTFAGQRMTWAAGWFNDWWTTDHPWAGSGNQFAARVTGLAYTSDDDANYLHLGVSGRYLGADDGTLQFRQRPESNTASYYIDTGKLPADHANEMGLEFVSGRGPFFLTSEYARAWVRSPDTGHPRFWSGYVAVSYVLTGEHRPYDRKVAYARRILPHGKWGAWEVFGRYSHVDGDDQQVEGGIMDKMALGLNWWATRRWKIGVDYWVANLDRFGTTGLTHAIHTRFQWIF